MRATRALTRTRRLPAALLAVLLIAPFTAAAAAAEAPAAPASTVSASMSVLGAERAPAVAGAGATDAPEEAPGEDTEPAPDQTDEGAPEADGPNPVVWFLAVAVLLAIAVGLVLLTRNQRTRV